MLFRLEDGIEWSVTETTKFPEKEDEYWDTVFTVDGVQMDSETALIASGTMSANGSAAVVSTSTYTTPTGTLVVRKSANDSTTQFNFTLTLDDGTEAQNFSLGNHQSKEFTIAEGTEWTVTESALSEHWTTEIEVDEVESESATGTISRGETQTVTFSNHYTAPVR